MERKVNVCVGISAGLTTERVYSTVTDWIELMKYVVRIFTYAILYFFTLFLLETNFITLLSEQEFIIYKCSKDTDLDVTTDFNYLLTKSNEKLILYL